MNDTLDSTFSLFFQDHDENVCIECGSMDDLEVIYESNHKPVRKCAACRAKFAAELAAEAERELEKQAWADFHDLVLNE